MRRRLSFSREELDFSRKSYPARRWALRASLTAPILFHNGIMVCLREARKRDGIGLGGEEVGGGGLVILSYQA